MNEANPGAATKKSGIAVVVLFEDGKAREEAVKFCDRMMDRLWARQEFRVDWWEFASFRNPSHVHEVLSQATEADVIVFATASHTEFPQELHQWVESWVPLRSEREGVVVGLHDPGAHMIELCPPKFVYLRTAAHRAGMDYWTDVPQNISRSVPDSLDSYSERAQHVSSVLDEILHHHPAPTLSPL